MFRFKKIHICRELENQRFNHLNQQSTFVLSFTLDSFQDINWFGLKMEIQKRIENVEGPFKWNPTAAGAKQDDWRICMSISFFISIAIQSIYVFMLSILGVLSKRTCSAQSRERAHSRELSSGKHFSSELTVDVKIFVCYININSLEKINLNK